MPSRLKHFCELCRKQCKDQNGFKCHLNSQSHQGRVRDYANNPLEHIERASAQFQGRFIQMLKVKYPGEPKYLQQLYNELLEEKKFLKFNHTQWQSLKQFAHHLQTIRNIKVIGPPPNCKVVYVVHKTKQFIQNSQKEKRLADKERQKQQLQRSITTRIQKEREFTQKQDNLLNQQLVQLKKESQVMEIPDRLQFDIQGFNPQIKRSAFYTTEELEHQIKEEEVVGNKKLDKIEKIYQQLKEVNQQSDEDQEIQWIKAGITIRIKPHEDIDPAFHNKKCKINKVVEPFVASVFLGTASIDIDQTNIETVIPKPGHQVMILYGQHESKVGVLKEVNTGDGYGVITVGEELVKMPFNLFSRLDKQLS